MTAGAGSRRRRPGQVAGFVALALLAGVGRGQEAVAPPLTLSFELLNGSYAGVAPEIAPIRQGFIQVDLGSAGDTLVLRRHQVRLIPRADGSHDARLELEVMGGGELIADVAVGGMSSRITDRVIVPAQTLTVPGRVRLQRRPEGLAITAVELPARLTVAIQSQLGNQLVGLCEQLAFLAASQCAPLAEALSQVEVPLPRPGETYLVPATSGTEEEWAAVEGYLARAARGIGPHIPLGSDS